MPPTPIQKRGGGRLGFSTFIVLVALLVAPGMALGRLGTAVDWRILAGATAAVSFFSWLAYWSDKRRAEAGEGRIPEPTLHFLELAGGWPGAFFAQRQFRHKTAKVSYQIVFWMIVLLHQLVALDFLLGWKLTKGLLPFFKA